MRPTVANAVGVQILSAARQLNHKPRIAIGHLNEARLTLHLASERNRGSHKRNASIMATLEGTHHKLRKYPFQWKFKRKTVAAVAIYKRGIRAGRL